MEMGQEEEGPRTLRHLRQTQKPIRLEMRPMPRQIKIKAKYEGRCPRCGLSIEKGEFILWSRDARPIHAGCDIFRPFRQEIRVPNPTTPKKKTYGMPLSPSDETPA
jgi:hypothetical protein